MQVWLQQINLNRKPSRILGWFFIIAPPAEQTYLPTGRQGTFEWKEFQKVLEKFELNWI